MRVTEHTVTAFDNELRGLAVKITQMGGIAEKMLVDAMSAMRRMDIALAQDVISTDERLDVLDREIDTLAVQLIARRQPVARDLREIVGAMKISADLERIGDLAKNIAKRVQAIHGESMPQKLLFGLDHISELALHQLKDVLDAYTRQDPDIARAVWARDTALDATFTSVFRELLTYMMEDPRNITPCTHLLFAAKNLERIGDHATNIAETVLYVALGDPVTESRPKGDTSSLETGPAVPSLESPDI